MVTYARTVNLFTNGVDSAIDTGDEVTIVNANYDGLFQVSMLGGDTFSLTIQGRLKADGLWAPLAVVVHGDLTAGSAFVSIRTCPYMRVDLTANNSSDIGDILVDVLS